MVSTGKFVSKQIKRLMGDGNAKNNHGWPVRDVRRGGRTDIDVMGPVGEGSRTVEARVEVMAQDFECRIVVSSKLMST